jgi:DNA-binding FadR family transcriptional regulator
VVAAASDNELLHRLLSVARDRVLVVAALHQDMRTTRAREVLLETRRILKGLMSGDLREIKASVLAHIRNSKKSILRAGAEH